jgi:hypothetical protein
VSLIASFPGSKIRKKIIREKSKIFKNSQAIKIIKSPNNLKKKCLVMKIGWKMHYLQPITWFYEDQNFSKIHKTDKKIFFGQNKTNTFLMILNDKPNCQVSSILMNPRPVFFGQNKKKRVVWYWMINQIAKFQGLWWTLVQFCPIPQRITQARF